VTGYAHQYAEMETGHAHHNRTKGRVRVSTKPRALSVEDEQILEAVNTIRRELEQLHNRYDNISDAILVESLIYEIKAAHMKYQYYLNLCKDKGIVCKV
jgi:hypothetical protein